VRPAEAAAIRKAADAVLTGMSLRQVVADLRGSGVPTVTGSDWTTASLRNILLRPSNGGLADYRGEIVSRDTEWPPILADDRQEAEHRWRELVAALTDPDRRTSPGNEPKWLGSLIYRCGCDCDRCQPDRRGRTNVAVSGGRTYARTYACRAHSHLRRAAGTGGLSGPLTGADDFVSRLLVARLSQRDATSLLAPPVSGPDVTGLRVELARLRRLLDDQARLHAREVITTSQLETGSRELQAKMRAVEEQLDTAGEHDPLVGIAGRPDAAQVWEGLSVAQRRQILRLLLDVTLLPARPGRRPGGAYFDADSIGVVWRMRAPRE
jgi:hypothetical protein